VLKWFRTKMGDWALPPAVQDSTGLKIDADFAPEPPGFWVTLLGIGSDGRIYTMDGADHKRLRPIILRDPRAVRNEEIAARARAARGGTDAPITIIGDGREYEPTLSQAEILPTAPRPTPDWVEWDNIVMPPKELGASCAIKQNETVIRLRKTTA
jgi:hypothetical protein